MSNDDAWDSSEKRDYDDTYMHDHYLNGSRLTSPIKAKKVRDNWNS